MVTTEIIKAILSEDKDRVIEAKIAIKSMLDIKAATFRDGAKKFIAKSIFESASDMGSTKTPNSIPDIAGHKGFDPTLDTAMGKDKTGHVFDPSTKATDAMTGVVGAVTDDPTNSGAPVVPPASFTASSGKIDTSDMFKDQIPTEDGLDTTIAILTGLEKGV